MGARTIMIIAACFALAACDSDDSADAHVDDDGSTPMDGTMPDGGPVPEPDDGSIPDDGSVSDPDGGTVPAPDDGSVPVDPTGELCEWTLDAISGDERPLLSGPSSGPDGPVRMLAVVPAGGFDYPDVRSMQIHFKGFGFVSDWIRDTDLPGADLHSYSAIALLGSAWVGLTLGADEVIRIAAAIDRGTDVLWMGPGLPQELGSRFGVKIRPDDTTDAANAHRIRFIGTGGRPVETPTFDEYFTELELDGAEALATFEPAGIPAVTTYRGENTWGRTVLIPFGLMHYWSESLDPDAWARAELVYDALTMLSSRGATIVSAFPDGHASAFLVRYEDINPGGTRFNQHGLDYVDRFHRVTAQLDDWGIPAHLGLVARYADPAMGEEFPWDAPGAGRELLRTAIESAIANHGAEIISHGYTHQYGTGDLDYTGVDWEFSDDATGVWVFLPWEEQLMRIIAAREELITQFGIAARIWETPHLDGNVDTYRAAAEAGFDIVNEGDGHLYPNRWGYQGFINDAILNVPHTTSYVPLDEDEAEEYTAAAGYYMMPRLTRMGAPFFLFYHGYVQGQEDALMALAGCAHEADFWTPTISEYADWWVERERTKARTSVEEGVMRVHVEDQPRGTTLVLRLPDGTRAGAVRVNGGEAQHARWQSAGIAFVRVVLPTGPADVEITLER